MYWQVYYHKTVVSAELMLINILKRAHELSLNGVDVFAPPSLSFFLKNKIEKNELNDDIMKKFMLLDDSDILSSVKVWQDHSDKVLSMLSSGLINRRLFRTVLSSSSDILNKKDNVIKLVCNKYNLSEKEASYFVSSGQIENNTYNAGIDKIWISYKDKSRLDITEASDQLDHQTLSKVVIKYYLSFPKAVSL